MTVKQCATVTGASTTHTESVHWRWSFCWWHGATARINWESKATTNWSQFISCKLHKRIGKFQCDGKLRMYQEAWQ